MFIPLIKMKKVDAILVGIAFLMVLFLNTYFNLTSNVAINEEAKELEDKFYLAGPDPYYNMRLLTKTLETGRFPYMGGKHGGLDPLLNYPLEGSGGRPPLFTMVTIGVGKFLSIFMPETDAMGYAMQILPAIYGALLVVPVYFIGRMIFNRKAGIIAAFIVALIPIHLSSGHGSAYSLYDHDSFILLLVTTSIMFLMMSLREKNSVKSMAFACLSGVFVASITMTWVSSHYIYALIGFYGIVQMLIDIITQRINVKVVRTVLLSLFTGYFLSFPVLWVKFGFSPTLQLFIPVIVAVFSIIYLWIGKKNIPWVISLPSIFAVAIVFLIFFYLIKGTTNPYLMPLEKISEIIFGKGIYGKKVSLTIAEASTFDFSRTVMSFGPALYWLGWLGFFLLIYRYYKKGLPKEYMTLIIWFLVESWLVSVAGRFLNDLVPLMAILGGGILWFAINKINFASMIKTIKSVGGGLYGFKKGVKIRHIAGAFLIAFFVILPNGWLAFDASLPEGFKGKFKSDKLGAFGLGLHTEKYWADAFKWLRHQTHNLSNKPGFIAWWDYGFYCVAMAENPTVADNFQEGIPPAANFHTSESEQEAVAVLIVRLLEGDYKKNGMLSIEARQIIAKYLGKDKAPGFIKIIEEPEKYENTSVGKIIGEEYGGSKYRVRPENARYHDAVKMITELDDENITMFYREVQNITGKSIRYYGVEGYDVNIFSVFTFLADKGIYGYEKPEDDYFKLMYVSQKTGEKFTVDEYEDLIESMPSDRLREIYGEFTTYVQRKDKFYDSMVYRVYLGETLSKSLFENATKYRYWMLLPFWTDNRTDPLGKGNYLYNPTVNLKHFVIKYLSPINKNQSLYFHRASLCYGMPAVVIAKYYEGAVIEGTLQSDGEPIENIWVIVRDDFKQTLQLEYGDRWLNRTIEKIPHDRVLTDENGHFKVIAPAGNITLAFYSGNVLLKEITFNKTGKFAPISEEEATRVKHWKRDIGIINIEKGGIKGIVFWDKDRDGKYNASVDEPLKATVQIGDKKITTGANGKFEVKKLLPKSYLLTVSKNGYDTKRMSVVIRPNETIWYNVSLTPSRVEIKGKVWYDANKNGKLDENETMPNVPINFEVINALDKNARNVSTSSDENGNYSMRLYPSKYRMVVNYTTTEDNKTVRYVYETIINVKIGDKTITRDIKLRRMEVSEQQ